MTLDEPEHIRLLRDATKRFVDQNMSRADARKWDKENIFPRETFAKLGQMGVMGLTVPAEYGGQGVDIPATMTVIEELAKRSAAIACPYIMAACYAGMNLVESGSETQKRAIPAQSRARRIHVRLRPLRTERRRRPRDGRNDGTPRRQSHPRQRHEALVHGRAHRRLRLLPRPHRPEGRPLQEPHDPSRRPEVERRHHPPARPLGIRGVETNDAIFDDVEVGEDAILGGPDMWNKGWRQLAGRALEVEKLELSAVALGLAEAAVADAIEYAETRIQFGKPIAAHQAIRHAIADAKTKTLAMRLMLYHAANLVQSGKPSALESSMTKLFCCEGAAEVTLACQRVMGAYGLSDLTDMERYVRDAISLPIVGGSSNMQKNNIANRLKLAE